MPRVTLPAARRASPRAAAAAAPARQPSPAHVLLTAALSAALLLCGVPAPVRADTSVLQGAARVVDGDTLYIGKEKVRLYAVDAPEKAQSCNDSKGRAYPCGLESLQALKERVGTKPVRCEVKQRDQYGRNVAACSILSPFSAEDMGTWLVANGHAVAYKQFGRDYVPLEQKAQSSHKGIWQGDFTEPALWRKQQKAASLNAQLGLPPPPGVAGQQQQQPAPPVVQQQQQQQQQPTRQAAAQQQPLVAAGSTGRPSYAAAVALGAGGGGGAAAMPVSSSSGVAGCSSPLIKGNINNKGEKIYHTPASGQYARVEIDERSGERFFCTEQEALAAGWRAALK